MSIQLAPGFAITPTHDTPTDAPAGFAPEPDPGPGLGPLSMLPGTWTGQGFNNIWRPFHDPTNAANDHFLELNLTDETLEFTPIPGTIPNRGLLQPDITMAGVNYLQQISDQNTLQGLHFEPGMWLNVPATTNPKEPVTVARLASIPHGTVMLAQGTFSPSPQPGPPEFPVVEITPFQVGNPNAKVPFPNESTLSNPSDFRSPPAAIKGITQGMVDNPNSVLQAAIAGQTILQTITLHVTSLPTPVAGGGTANTAFLQGAAPGGGNADAAQVEATFWIETVQGQDGQNFLQLQYSQRVLLDFNHLSWPHFSVATLRLSNPVPLTPQG
ncbi:MAG TPA: heme-binding protein [Longimicrobium sp.]